MSVEIKQVKASRSNKNIFQKCLRNILFCMALQAVHGYRCATFSLSKLPQLGRMSQMSSASLFFFILAFCAICLNEDCRRHYEEIDRPSPQRVKKLVTFHASF